MQYPVVFPIAMITGDIRTILYGPIPFVTGTGDAVVHHPAEVWAGWTAEEWAAKAPGIRLLPVIDAAPVATDGARYERQPDAEWTEGADAITVTYRLVDLSPAELAVQAAAAGAALKTQVADSVQRHIDSAVAPRNYASAAAAVSYVDDPNPQWDAEARAVRAWRSAVWQVCFATLDDVLAGRRAPLNPAEMVAELPPLVWPE